MPECLLSEHKPTAEYASWLCLEEMPFTEARNHAQVRGGTSMSEELRSDCSLVWHTPGHIKVAGMLLSLASPIVKEGAQHVTGPSDS